MKIISIITAFLTAVILCGCNQTATSDQIQQAQQERILQEGTAAIGMPAIKNFRRKRLLKDIMEMCDQDGLTTYTYLVAEQTGKLSFLGESIGYGIPVATQFTNPQKAEWMSNHGYLILPQADPDGLFSPANAEGTWVVMKDPHGGTAQPVYIEPRVIVSPFPLETK